MWWQSGLLRWQAFLGYACHEVYGNRPSSSLGLREFKSRPRAVRLPKTQHIPASQHADQRERRNQWFLSTRV